jgi:hypothetical protein
MPVSGSQGLDVEIQPVAFLAAAQAASTTWTTRSRGAATLRISGSRHGVASARDLDAMVREATADARWHDGMKDHARPQ